MTDALKQQWSYFCRMEGIDFKVHCFSTVVDLSMCKTTTSERIEIILVDEIKYLRPEMIENLPWLVHLAVDHLQDGRPNFTVSDYSSLNAGLIDRNGNEQESLPAG